MSENVRKISDIEYREGNYVVTDGKKLLNMSSNDYLSISTNRDLLNEFLLEKSQDKEFLMSSASARLLSGTSSVYKRVEKILSDMFQKEAALIFNTGYQCNLGVISALYKKGDVIFSDKLNHASIIAGMKLSGADFFRYKHLDYEHLESFLKMHRDKYNKALIVSESVFSMDGDIADIDKLIELKTKYNAELMIDEAHAFLVFGKNLAGLTEGKDVDIITATFGKALGSEGAFCVSDKNTIETLINNAGSFIFSTAIAPSNVLWTEFILNQKDFLKEKQKKLQKLFKAFGFSTQIIPVIIGETSVTERVCEQLKSKGYFVLPIRPPTVPNGTSRIRLSLCADMDYDQIKQLFNFVEDVKNEVMCAK
ncbi:pyridoxal phosphate-dependent aminotransferase family protein [bacterium]|nr:pyridoxal phosphate-dependent aminotransferase family protein [bacterium]